MRTQAENRSTAGRDDTRPRSRPAVAPSPLAALQGTAGNAAVARAIQRVRAESEPEAQQADGAVPVQRRSSVPEAVSSPGSPLEPRIQQRAEQAYGMPFGHVRVHNDAVAQRSAAELGALAYTSGPHIVLGGKRVSDETMFEEVDHVRQQAMGPVPGTPNGHGERVSHPDDPFEKSASSNGRKLARGAMPDLALPGSSAPPAEAVQRSADEDVPVQRVDADRPGPSAADTGSPAPSSGSSTPPSAAIPAIAQLARLLVGGDAVIKNKHVRAALHRRVRGGPSFTDAELRAIKAVETEDPKWLKTVGIGTHAEAEAYIKAGDFHSWLEQPEGKRLLVATLRWHQAAGDRAEGMPVAKQGRPDYQMGRHMAMHDAGTPSAEREALKGERDEQIFQTFVKTMLPPGVSDDVPDAKKHNERVKRGTELLTKIFLILKEGLKVFNPETGFHEDFEDDVAHALAYGGRVNIRIPQLADGEHGYELPRWLHITKEDRKFWEPRSTPEKPVYRRPFGTHHMDIGANAEDARGDFVEKGGLKATGQNWLDPHSHLYGLPLAIGGMGNNDYHGDTILPNESYGHMFMGYKPPSDKRDGALQVGIETAGPGGRTPDGYKHGITSSEKNNNPVSQVGGHKDDKIGNNAPLSASQRLVDMKDFGDWVAKLNELERNWKAAIAEARTHEEKAALYRDLIGKRTNIGS